MMRGVLAAALLVLGSLPGHAAEPLRIQAANAPLAHFAARIAGDTAEVVMPVPESTDPAFWQPSIPELTALQEADLILLQGDGLYGWTQRVSLPRSRVVDTLTGLDDQLIAVESTTHRHGSEPEHSHAATATNTWLDFRLAERQAATIAEALSRARPDAAPAFQAGLEALASDLAALDEAAAALTAGLEGSPLLVLHGGYEYFARRYTLSLVELGPEAAALPEPAAVAALDAVLAEHEASILLLEGLIAEEATEVLASRGILPVVLDPATAAPTAEVIERWQAGISELAAAAEGDATDR